MNHPIADLGDLVCETLTFCYSPVHKKSLEADAREMGGTYEQFIAAAIAQRVSERFVVRHRQSPDPKDN